MINNVAFPTHSQPVYHQKVQVTKDDAVLASNQRIEGLLHNVNANIQKLSETIFLTKKVRNGDATGHPIKKFGLHGLVTVNEVLDDPKWNGAIYKRDIKKFAKHLAVELATKYEFYMIICYKIFHILSGSYNNMPAFDR